MSYHLATLIASYSLRGAPSTARLFEVDPPRPMPHARPQWDGAHVLVSWVPDASMGPEMMLFASNPLGENLGSLGFTWGEDTVENLEELLARRGITLNLYGCAPGEMPTAPPLAEAAQELAEVCAGWAIQHGTSAPHSKDFA